MVIFHFSFLYLDLCFQIQCAPNSVNPDIVSLTKQNDIKAINQLDNQTYQNKFYKLNSETNLNQLNNQQNNQFNHQKLIEQLNDPKINKTQFLKDQTYTYSNQIENELFLKPNHIKERSNEPVHKNPIEPIKNLFTPNQYGEEYQNSDDLSDENELYKFFHEFRKSFLPIHGYLSFSFCIFGIIANVLNIIVLTR